MPRPYPATAPTRSDFVPARAIYPALLLVASLVAGGVYLLAAADAAEPSAATAALPAPAAPAGPTAQEFAHAFTGATNAHAAATGDARRVRGADCVKAARAAYMCSYASVRPGARRQCHVVQARWTPDAASTITVDLAGSVDRCGTLREALRSLN
jgi:hypothetical protein